MVSTATQQESRFLKLPLELRRHIYSYVLPYTIKPKPLQTSHLTLQPTILWVRHSTSVLRTCRQLHEECVDMLYGTNTFVIDINFHSVKFHLTWLTTRGLKPKILYEFPNLFARRNVIRIRNYAVTVEHVDSYHGTIKFNCGGPMLTAGIKDRVMQFARVAGCTPKLGNLSVRLTDGNPILKELRSVQGHRIEQGSNPETIQEVLEPFVLLHASYVEFSGLVLPEYASCLKQGVLQEQKESAQALVASGGPDIEPAVLWRWQMNWNA